MNISELFSRYGTHYFQALIATWQLTGISFLLACITGIIATVLRICPISVLRAASNIFIQVFRNIPGATLLIILVYAFPYLNITLSYYTCVLIATTLIPAAFCSEYLLSGINTINPGQIEAARALGLSFTKILRLIVLPQALRTSILSLTNLLVATMLTTALASQVPMNPHDLTGIVDYINTHDTGGITPFTVSALLYCATALVIGQIGNALDRKLRIKR